MDLRYQWNIIGHDKQLLELEHDLQNSNVAHAYLLAGPGQVGKFSIVKTLAHILQCENNFCHNCLTCQHIDKGYHADTIELSDNGESLKIEQIRELLFKLSTTTQSRYKVVLMQNIERLTPESANALLKTLEDPPPNVVFLLTTSNLKSLLTTIISRVRLLKFKNLSKEFLHNFLTANFPEKSEADLKALGLLALGKPGKALALMADEEVFHNYRAMYEQLFLLMEKGDLVERFRYVGEVAKNPQQLEDFLQVFLAVARQNLLQLAENGSDQDLIQARINLIRDLQQTYDMLQRNVNGRLALENLMLVL